jgi:hypothetical protein
LLLPGSAFSGGFFLQLIDHRLQFGIALCTQSLLHLHLLGAQLALELGADLRLPLLAFNAKLLFGHGDGRLGAAIGGIQLELMLCYIGSGNHYK